MSTVICWHVHSFPWIGGRIMFDINSKWHWARSRTAYWCMRSVTSFIIIFSINTHPCDLSVQLPAKVSNVLNLHPHVRDFCHLAHSWAYTDSWDMIGEKQAKEVNKTILWRNRSLCTEEIFWIHLLTNKFWGFNLSQT